MSAGCHTRQEHVSYMSQPSWQVRILFSMISTIFAESFVRNEMWKLSLLLLPLVTNGFLSKDHRGRCGVQLYSSRKDDDEEIRRKMEVVRSLQLSFYKSEMNATTNLDFSTGMINNLPLWRVQWTELPGRTNVLNVHEPMYTNMFESVLHTAPPWYIGHVYLPGGSKNIKAQKDRKYSLHAWEDVVPRDRNVDQSAVLGTLLRIADFRRVADGRLLLLVQAVERFVITDVKQELPYGVADVQLLPDTEEVEESDWMFKRSEGDVRSARGLSAAESFLRWHRYEYENTMLPLPLQSDLNPDDVVGSALAKVLPYAPFSRVIDVSRLKRESLPNLEGQLSKASQHLVDSSEKTLEYRLLEGNVLRQPLLPDSLLDLTADELELRIWIALNDFLKQSKTAVSPVLFGLMPPGQQWPADFVLEKIATAIDLQTSLDHKYVRVANEYPAIRRQKRLSFSAAALLEEIDTVNNFRQELLEIPSTKARLAFILQKLERKWDAFQ